MHAGKPVLGPCLANVMTASPFDLQKLFLQTHAAALPKGVNQVPNWLLQLWWNLQRCPGNASRGPTAPSNIATLLWCNQSTMPEHLVLPQS
jgi:hypothetical protein